MLPYDGGSRASCQREYSSLFPPASFSLDLPPLAVIHRGIWIVPLIFPHDRGLPTLAVRKNAKISKLHLQLSHPDPESRPTKKRV
jgi:hypothetical protein